MKDKIVISVVILIAFLAGIYFLTRPKAVLAPLPTPTDNTIGWKNFTDPTNGVSFKYPETLPTTYITPTEWPPKTQVIQGAFVCTNGGEEIQSTGQTNTQIINGHEYCVTKLVLGAAGSMYTQYGYITKVGDKYVSFAFTIRSVQCANYPDPEKTICDTERAAFSIDPIIDQIIQSAKLSS